MDFKGYILRQKAIIRSRSAAYVKNADSAAEAVRPVRDENPVENGARFTDYATESERLFSELDNLTGLNMRERLSFCA